LPPEARFCHKCGKPQFEEPPPGEEEAPEPDLPVLEAAAPEREAAALAVPAGISFRNRLAVRVGLLTAALASLLTSLPMPMFLNLLWLVVCLTAAGFFAVYLYRRRSGEELSARMGARLGWITGVFCFLIATVFFTITVIIISAQGGLAAYYREQLSQQAGPGIDVEELVSVLETPVGLASVLLFTLVVLFVFFTLLPTLGGAMGAKVLAKD